MKYIFLATFFVFSILHLYASKKNNDFFRAVTKGFILFPLISYYILSVNEPSMLVVLALLLSWLGDMFLIPKSTKMFVVGGLAFMTSHVLFIFSYLEAINNCFNVPIWAIIIVALVFILLVVIIFGKLKQYLSKALFYPMLFYLLINGTMNSFAIFRLISVPSIGSVIAVIGALLFFASDTCLFFTRFNKNSIFKTHFTVMLTYLVGELLIVLGFIL